jgi:hypothetical protein
VNRQNSRCRFSKAIQNFRCNPVRFSQAGREPEFDEILCGTRPRPSRESPNPAKFRRTKHRSSHRARWFPAGGCACRLLVAMVQGCCIWARLCELGDASFLCRPLPIAGLFSSGHSRDWDFPEYCCSGVGLVLRQRG